MGILAQTRNNKSTKKVIKMDEMETMFWIVILFVFVFVLLHRIFKSKWENITRVPRWVMRKTEYGNNPKIVKGKHYLYKADIYGEQPGTVCYFRKKRKKRIKWEI